MYETHWFQVSIFCWRLETISINVNKTRVECFEYTVASRRRSPSYHDQFNAVFPMLMHYFCFTNATTPVSRPRPHSSCYKTANRAPRNTTTIFYPHPHAGKLATCQQQFAQLHHVILKQIVDAGSAATEVSRVNIWLLLSSTSIYTIKTKIVPHKICFAPPNLKTWLRTWCIVWLLASWYRNQTMLVKWGVSLSDPFSVINEVRQGDIWVYIYSLFTLIRFQNSRAQPEQGALWEIWFCITYYLLIIYVCFVPASVVFNAFWIFALDWLCYWHRRSQREPWGHASQTFSKCSHYLLW